MQKKSHAEAKSNNIGLKWLSAAQKLSYPKFYLSCVFFLQLQVDYTENLIFEKIPHKRDITFLAPSSLKSINNGTSSDKGSVFKSNL